MSTATIHLIYGLAWLSFMAGHSLLAGDRPESPLGRLFGAYARLAYNIIAGVHVAAVFGLGLWLFRDRAAYDFTALQGGLLTGLQLLGWAVMLYSLKDYDLGLFGGTKQVRRARAGLPANEDEPLKVGGVHRYVRHPLYSGAFLILWGRITNEQDLLTAAFGSVYLIVGSRFEERRLIRIYGQDYADYRKLVPAFLPWRGRVAVKTQS